MRDLKSNYGPWAMVTGASSGIGREFVVQLAALGFNVVLVARSEEKLLQVASKVKEDYQIQTLAIPTDLSSADFLTELIQKTSGIEIGLLVSNAGGYKYGSFHKSDLNELAAFLRLNTNAHMQLAHYYGNKMKASKRGGILFVSSTGAFTAIPYMASYTASKAYVQSLGEALYIELRSHGVDVMVLSPGTTETPGTMNAENIDNAKLGVSFMSAAIVVQQALKAFGKKNMFIPGGINKCSYFLSKRVLTRTAMSKILGSIMKKAISKEVI